MKSENGANHVDDAVHRADLVEMHGFQGRTVDRCFRLGEVYATGRGVTQRYGRAIELYDRACDGGHGEAAPQRSPRARSCVHAPSV